MKNIVTIFFIVFAAAATQAQTTQKIDSEKFAQLMQQSNTVVIDVRTPDEFNQGHIPHALAIDYFGKDFVNDLDKLNKDKIYLVYCQSGPRSEKTVSYMNEHGFKTVYSLEGGFENWKGETEK